MNDELVITVNDEKEETNELSKNIEDVDKSSAHETTETHETFVGFSKDLKYVSLYFPYNDYVHFAGKHIDNAYEHLNDNQYYEIDYKKLVEEEKPDFHALTSRIFKSMVDFVFSDDCKATIVCGKAESSPDSWDMDFIKKDGEGFKFNIIYQMVFFNKNLLVYEENKFKVFSPGDNDDKKWVHTKTLYIHRKLGTIVSKDTKLFTIDEYGTLTYWNKEFIKSENDFHLPKDFDLKYVKIETNRDEKLILVYNDNQMLVFSMEFGIFLSSFGIDFIKCANFIYTNDGEIEHLFVIIGGSNDNFIFMEPSNLNNTNDMTKIYEEYLSIKTNKFNGFQIQDNKLIVTSHSYCRVYNILDEKITKKISYNHLKSFSFIFPYVGKALDKLLLGENIDSFNITNELELKFENVGSIKWIVSLSTTDNVCVNFKSQKDSKEDIISFNIKTLFSYEILKNEDLLLITKNDGIHVYSVNVSGKIYQKFNSNLYVDDKILEKNIEKFTKFDFAHVKLGNLELHIHAFQYILEDTLALAKYGEKIFNRATEEKDGFIAELIYNKYIEVYKQNPSTNLPLLRDIVLHLTGLNTFNPVIVEKFLETVSIILDPNCNKISTSTVSEKNYICDENEENEENTKKFLPTLSYKAHLLRNTFQAMFIANDGIGFPFMFLALYLLQRSNNTEIAGSKNWIDKESFLVFAFALAVEKRENDMDAYIANHTKDNVVTFIVVSLVVVHNAQLSVHKKGKMRAEIVNLDEVDKDDEEEEHEEHEEHHQHPHHRRRIEEEKKEIDKSGNYAKR
nr:10012_t:CDS:2 [Entrophospora candida]